MSATGVKCGLCKATVYPHEPNLALDGRKFHSKCAKCADCGKNLSLTDFGKASDFIDGDMSVFCKRHYEERFLRSDSKYKGKWERSQIHAVNIVVNKRKTAEESEDVEEEEEEEKNPLKRLSVEGLRPLQMSVENVVEEIVEEVNEVVKEAVIADVQDISAIEVEASFMTDTGAEVLTAEDSEGEASPFAGGFNSRFSTEKSNFVDENSPDQSVCSVSPLNTTLNTRQSTEKTDFMIECNEVVMEPLFVEESNATEEVTISAPVLTAPEEQPLTEVEEEGLSAIQKRIRALNRAPSKFVPIPSALKKADAIDVQYFGPHRLTSRLGENAINAAQADTPSTIG